MRIHFEIPLDKDLTPYINALQGTHVAAKIRTGGIVPDAFPTVVQLYQCIHTFAEAQIPFKATAGLHHPLRASYPVTYDAGSPTTAMHGFLNVAILSALLYQRPLAGKWQARVGSRESGDKSFGSRLNQNHGSLTMDEGLDVIQTSSIQAFHFTDDRVSWNNYHLSLPEIETARQRFFRSFGSCSFQEPIHNLQQLRLL